MTFWPKVCHHNLQPLKRICRINPETLPETTNPEYEFEYIDIGNVALESGVVGRERMTFGNSPSRARKPVRPDDVIVSTVRTYLKAVASISSEADRWVVSTGFAVLRNKPCIEPRYLYRVAQSSPFVESVVAVSTGVSYPAISPSTLGRIPVPLLDKKSQRLIADFLDRETDRVDQLIEKKRRLVEVLNEKQAAEIDSLVLGNRDSSGQPSLNEAQREVWKLKTLCSRLGNGFVGPTRDILVDEDTPDAVPYLQSTHVKNRRIEFERKPYFVERTWLITKPKARVEAGDLVVVQTGDCGATAIIDSQFSGSGCHAMIITRPITSRILPKLLLHILSSNYGRSRLAAIQTGALHPHLEVGFVKEVPIPLPSMEKQEGLLQEIERTIERLEGIRDRTIESVERLHEFRAALVTAAVTGQIDVETWGKRGRTDRRLDMIEKEMDSARAAEQVEARA
jgi:type I restriction enzyme S subunit